MSPANTCRVVRRFACVNSMCMFVRQCVYAVMSATVSSHGQLLLQKLFSLTSGGGASDNSICVHVIKGIEFDSIVAS